MENMELWNQVCVTDPKTTKKVEVGRGFTAICAQTQLKKATELWGAFGSTWGVKEEKHIIHDKIAYYTGKLYFPHGLIEIHSDINLYTSKGAYNEDWTKKLATDALTKGLSKLGFNSDVFEGKFDDNKYIKQPEDKKKKPDQTLLDIQSLCLNLISDHKEVLGADYQKTNTFFSHLNKNCGGDSKIAENYKQKLSKKISDLENLENKDAKLFEVEE